MGKLEAVLAKPECKIMLLCSPQNPTGKVWTCDELEIMADLCERHGVRVISDEIHMDMVWGEQPHIPWSNVARGDWALLTSGSKSFNIPALTGAYGIIENSSSRDAYLSALKGRDGLSSPSVLALTAHIAAYQQGAPWLDALRVYLKDNLTYISDKMNAAFPELNWQIPQSTYLAWLDLRPLNIDDNALQKRLSSKKKSRSCRGIPMVKKVVVLSVSMPAAHVRNWKRCGWINKRHPRCSLTPIAQRKNRCAIVDFYPALFL